MTNVMCIRCKAIAYQTKAVGKGLDGEHVEVDVELCAGCRAKASQENNTARQRDRGRW